jgi:F420-dependent oxidoreductase-like protein
VDRNGDARLEALDRFGRAGGVEMEPAAELQAPAPHGEEGEIEVRREAGHLRKKVGVAGEVRLGVAFDDVAQRTRFARERGAAAGVVGGRGADGDGANGRLIAGVHLGDLAEAAAGEQVSDPARDDDARVAAEAEERREVEVVVVGVGDEDRVHVGWRLLARGDAAEVQERATEHRVGDEPHAVQFEDTRAVADVEQLHSRETTHVRVALMIEGQDGVTWEQWLMLARTAEDAGIEALFRSDHYSSPRGHGRLGSLDAWTTLAALAAATERIRLGTLVSPVTFRHPSQLARAVTTVDHVSGGRVELGMGAGWMDVEHRAFGFPFPPLPDRMAMLAEQAEIVHRQWTEDSFDFGGRFYELRDARALPKPVQRPHPPLVIGGKGKRRSLAIAARWADEYNTFYEGPDFIRKLRPRLDEALRGEGRDPASVPLSLMTPVEGSPGQMIARLRAFGEAGVERVFLQHLDHEDLETVRAIGQEVVPALR